MTDDDVFAALTAGLEDELEVDSETVVDVAALDSAALSERFNEARDELIASDEMLIPKTPRGRELHSIRAACLVELAKRGLR